MSRQTFVQAQEKEDFSDLIKTFFDEQNALERCLAKGYVREVGEEDVLVDVRSKGQAYIAEGYVSLKEFAQPGEPLPQVGDIVDIYIERFEGRDGGVVLSREQARREASWEELQAAFDNNRPVEGIIFSRVRGGFTVNLKGVTAFLPGSQIDIRPIQDPTSLMNTPQKFLLLRMDRARNNVVVSRRSVIEESRSGEKAKLFEKLYEGQVLRGKVKNITDYGAFVDLGGVDGLLHVTDMSWARVQNPRDILALDEVIDVKVIRFNKETGRISLGLKQLKEHPWKGMESNFAIGKRLLGVVTSIVDYGAFVELEGGVEGLVHSSEMSWQRRIADPHAFVKVGDKVEVEVLDMDIEKHRLSLGMKQCKSNPWDRIEKEFQPGKSFKGTITDTANFGLFVEVVDGIDGVVYSEDLSWDVPGDEALRQYKKGDEIRVKVLRVDRTKDQLVLGVKQLEEVADTEKYTVGETVTCIVQKIVASGLCVTFGDGKTSGFIRKVDLARDVDERRTDRFALNEKIDAQIVGKEGRWLLSIRARQLAEEETVLKNYGSTESGASLGEILGINNDGKTTD